MRCNLLRRTPSQKIALLSGLKSPIGNGEFDIFLLQHESE